MSHSTHVGFNFTGGFCGFCSPPLRLQTIDGRSLVPFQFFDGLLAIASDRTGVGHKPEPVSLVRSSNVGSSQHCPAAVIPARGQVTEHSSESPSKERWAVFHEDVSGSNLANDPRHMSPHSAAASVDACPSACNADVLTWKAARNDVNTAAPRSAVKGLNVIPNREGREKAVILSGGKYASCVGFPLDGADGTPSKQVTSEYASTSACEKSQLIHASPSSSMASSTDCTMPATPPLA
jgi:hypothetical protein